MTLSKFVFKSHKWLAVGVGLLTVMWFVTGVVIVLPANLLGGPPSAGAREEGIAFEQASITVPQAVAAARAAAGKPIAISGVSLLRLPGKLLYEVSVPQGYSILIDALTGERFEVNEASARQMATVLLGGRGQVTEVVLQRKTTWDYTFGPLPVYRVTANDPEATVFFFAKNTGFTRTTNRLLRMRALFHDAHSLAVLRPYLPGGAVKLLLISTSVVGTVMSIFGMWILWIQWKNWLAARRARAARAA